MAHYSVEPRDTIFAKGYGLLSFVKNMGENIGTILSGKQQTQQMNLRLLQKYYLKKTSKATGDLICNSFAHRITNVSET